MVDKHQKSKECMTEKIAGKVLNTQVGCEPMGGLGPARQCNGTFTFVDSPPMDQEPIIKTVLDPGVVNYISLNLSPYLSSVFLLFLYQLLLKCALKYLLTNCC